MQKSSKMNKKCIPALSPNMGVGQSDHPFLAKKSVQKEVSKPSLILSKLAIFGPKLTKNDKNGQKRAFFCLFGPKFWTSGTPETWISWSQHENHGFRAISPKWPFWPKWPKTIKNHHLISQNDHFCQKTRFLHTFRTPNGPNCGFLEFWVSGFPDSGNPKNLDFMISSLFITFITFWHFLTTFGPQPPRIPP